MNLIIVESPTKAKTLNRFLGDGYTVEATMGHIKDLPKSKLSIDVEKSYEPDYVVVDAKKKSINAIKKAAKGAKMIYVATDPDREGEAIAQHVYEILLDSKCQIPNSKLHRIVFHEITKSAVEDAIGRPGKVDRNLVDAQIARRVLDRLVGYKLSPVLWKKVRRGLSAGRVQTVAVRLIVEKEREIDKFKPVEYWEINCDLRSHESGIKNQELRVGLVKVNNKKAEVSNEKQAKEVVSDLEKANYVVTGIIKKEVKTRPFPPFTTSTLTQSAARLFGWSAKRTMSVAQKLYEEGLITYHRTDSMSLSKQAVEQVRKFIPQEYGDKYLPQTPRFYKTKSKSAQEAHEAIRPTNVDVKSSELQGKGATDAEKLYKLIWKRFVACQMVDGIYDRTRIVVTATGKAVYELRAAGQIMKFDGWRKIIPVGNAGSGKKRSDDVQLPSVSENDPLDLVKVNSEQKFTQPPARYNEASLIKTLESLGIGRPSTYAPTISTIQTRKYVEKDEGRFYPTKVGIAVNDFMVGNFDKVFDYDFTASMEEDLDEVAEGKLDWHKMMDEFYKPFEKKVVKVEKEAKRVKIETEKLGKPCPECGKKGIKREGEKGLVKGELVIRIGRFGKFISCSNFPDCKYTEKYVEKIDMKCPDCVAEGLPADRQGDVIIKSTRRGAKFFGCSRYPDCKWASWKKPGDTKENKS